MAYFKFYITYNSITTEIKNVDGWDGIGREYLRSPKYDTPLRRISAPIGILLKDGGSIIRDAYYLTGLDSVIQFRVDIYNSNTDAYDLYLTSIIDLKPENFKIDDTTVHINLIDSSKENRFMCNDEINFDVLQRTAIDGSTVDAFTNETQTVDITIPTIILYTDIDGVNGGKQEAAPFIESLLTDEELYPDDRIVIDKITNYPASKISFTSELNDWTEREELIPVWDGDISIPNYCRIKLICKEKTTETGKSNDEIACVFLYYASYQRSVYAKEEIIFRSSNVEHTLSTRIIEFNAEIGDSTVFNYRTFENLNISNEFVHNYIHDEDTTAELYIKLTWKARNTIPDVGNSGFRYNSFPYIEIEFYEDKTKTENDYFYPTTLKKYPFTYDKFLQDLNINKNENDNANKLTGASFAIYENTNNQSQEFTIDIETSGNLVLSFISITEQALHSFGGTYKAILTHKSGDAETLYEIYDRAISYVDTTQVLPDRYFNDYLEEQISTAIVTVTKDLDSSTGSKTLELLPGDKVELKFVLYADSEQLTNLKLESCITSWSDIQTSVNYVTKILDNSTITVQGFYLQEAFTRLIQLATGEQNHMQLFRSEILGKTDSQFQTYVSNGQWSNIFVTSGRLLRNYPNEKLSLNIFKLFDICKKAFNLCLGYDRTNLWYWIEDKFEAYQNENIGALDNVDNFVMSLNEELFYNQIKVGINKQDYDYAKGANEYITEYEYAVNSPVKNTIDLTHEYRTDTLGIALQLLHQYTQFPSKDLKGDDDIFLIECEGGAAKTNGTLFTGFDGIETYLNQSFIARNVLKRNCHILMPQFKRISATELIFIKSAKNVSQIQLPIEVNIDGNIGKIGLTDVLISPEIYEFECVLTPAQIIRYELNPNGYWEIPYRGRVYQGYTLSIKRGEYKEKSKLIILAKGLTTGENLLLEDEKELLLENDINMLIE